MAPSPTSRLVAFHVAARADDAAIRTALAAAEVVHEPDPLAALAELGCRELAAKNRGTWGLGPAERFAVVLGDDRPELERLRLACERHLPGVELWRTIDGRFLRLDPPSPKVRSVASPSPASPPPQDADSTSSPRVVSAEEIRMLLGNDNDDDDSPRSPGGSS